tara:strand:- start:799 stop:1152 length:354 start_codon:yes stop_codon:yes gene_type:complete
MWPAGDSVFFVTDLNELVRLDSDTGQEIWKRDLPGYEPKRNPNRRRDGSFANHGPVLAGGRLIVASTDGKFVPSTRRMAHWCRKLPFPVGPRPARWWPEARCMSFLARVYCTPSADL